MRTFEYQNESGGFLKELRNENQPEDWFQIEQKENRAILNAWWNKYVDTDTFNSNTLNEMTNGFKFYVPQKKFNKIFSRMSTQPRSI